MRTPNDNDFEPVYREHVRAVFRFALHTVGRRDLAEEITSEAFLELYRNFNHVDLAQLPAWLITVARNRAIAYWRHAAVESRYAESLATSPAYEEPRVESWLFDSKALKPVHRACLILRYVHGMDRAEIAEETGLTETQVKGHLQYARQLLRRELEQDRK